MSDDKLVSSDLIDDIYAAALGEQGWDTFLQKLRGTDETRLVNLLSFDNSSQLPSLITIAGDGGAWIPDCFELYNSTFYQHDPASAIVGNWEAGRWYEDTIHLSEQRKSRHVFYQEFLRSYELDNLSGLFIHRGPNESAYLSFLGGAGTPGLSANQRRQVDVLIPHISRSLRMQTQLRQLESRTAIAEASLHSLSFPVFILDEARTLLYANDAANQLMTNEPALAFRHGQFCPTAQYAATDWRQACAVGGLLLRRSSGKPLPLTLIPIPERSRLTQLSARRLVLMTTTDIQSPETKVQRLRAFFGLTAAEADLAILLSCEGLSPQECADARGVLVATVRSQIKSIYTKTGVSRTAQLSQLVFRL